MAFQDFIFSTARPDRIKQHILFWGLWYPYITLTHAAFPFGYPEMAYFRNPIYTFTESFFIVLAQVPITYGILYFVLPRYILKRKYVLSLVFVIIFWFICGASNLVFLGKIMPKILSYILPKENLPAAPRTEGVSFFMAVIATNKGALTIAASALMVKFAKHWYHKEHRNLQLQKENAQSQLRLLTAQIHPHFLFNTLNNIYSVVQPESKQGATMVMGLSDLLRYIIYEGQKNTVPLKDELAMIEEYINLEKIRYGNKLEMHVLLPKDTSGYEIAPLLLLPLVENCFKHGTSHMLKNPWINLTMDLNGHMLVMKLMNGKMTRENNKQQQGLGIANVKQRLELLYKNKYELVISEDNEVYVVDLRLELLKTDEKKQAPEIETLVKPMEAYAQPVK